MICTVIANKVIMNENLSLENQLLKEYWTEHRITLIAFQMQYVFQTQTPLNHSPSTRAQDNHQMKRKSIDYEGGFLFPTRKFHQDISLQELILNSSCPSLKRLFFSQALDEDQHALQQFIRIMLSLKHSTIVHQFMELYQIVLTEIKDIAFERLVGEEVRKVEIQELTLRVIRLMQEKVECRLLKEYLKENKIQTTKLIKVTIYCFLAERYNFNINEYYAQAFQMTEERKPDKKLKMS